MSLEICLEWNNHVTIINELKNLLAMEALVDVTLVCDGASLKAHKLILSACSPYFQSLFSENPVQHSIVILKDIKYVDLKAVIDFIYHGQVIVIKEQLADVIKAAEFLKIKVLGDVMNANNYSDNESENEAEFPEFDESQDQCGEVSLASKTNTTSPNKKKNKDWTLSFQSDDEVSESEKMTRSPTESSAGTVALHSPDLDAVTEPLQSNNTNFHQKCQEQQIVLENVDESDREKGVEDTASNSEEITKNDSQSDNDLNENGAYSTLFMPYVILRDVIRSMSNSRQSNSQTGNVSGITYRSSSPESGVGSVCSATSMTLELDNTSSSNMETFDGVNDMDSTTNLATTGSDSDELIQSCTDIQSFADSPHKKIQKKKKLKNKSKKSALASLEFKKSKVKGSDASSSRKVLGKIENTGASIRWGKYYKCRESDQCTFKTKYSESLKRHVTAKHKKVRSFKCEQCSYAATLRQHLKRHISYMHENPIKFFCNACTYKTAQSGNLKRHLEIVHEGKKPFKCEKCGLRSAQKAHIKKHMLAVHEQRRDFTCDSCTYRCSAKENLKRHVNLKHRSK